ncbi:MAG TPA: type II toxin-antitoxin system VapC family toxin [Tepidisphaeraceae bacterium]|nr:type II toxin-antitoxin system VapC family toxin [Tepidisphaeraceae bacterium]
MQLLLDTHAWLWFALGDAKLSVVAKAAILDPLNVKHVSPASYWEISIKIRMGKYVLATPYTQFMREAMLGNGFKHLAITPEHTERVSILPFPHGDRHRDPFDRLLISQALVEGMILVSDDTKFAAYGVPVLW